MDMRLLVFAFSLLACDEGGVPSGSHLCNTLGLCDVPAAPAVAHDILCDVGSSCNRETLDGTLQRVLKHVADRPGSHIRFWTLGADLSETTVIAEQTVPAPARSSERSRRAQEERFVEDASDYFLAAASHAFDRPPSRSRPIAAAITKVAMTGTDRMPRHVVMITDGRESSDIASFACSPPPEKCLLPRLKRRRLLEPGTLAGIAVHFGFNEYKPVKPAKGCEATIAKELQVRELWSSALRAAGATSVTFSTTVPNFDALVPATSSEEKSR